VLRNKGNRYDRTCTCIGPSWSIDGRDNFDQLIDCRILKGRVP
jgi:hypothetical protein